MAEEVILDMVVSVAGYRKRCDVKTPAWPRGVCWVGFAACPGQRREWAVSSLYRWEITRVRATEWRLRRRFCTGVPNPGQ